MTKKEIITAIEHIKEISDSNEDAHIEEDSLREAFIESIAERKDDLGEKARLVLSTNELDFERWYC